MRKRGQVTIFIILGVVIIAAVAFSVVYFEGKGPTTTKVSSSNPEAFLYSCLSNDVQQQVNNTASHGGNSTLTTRFLFSGMKNPTTISYLCYTSNDSGVPCTNLYSVFPYFEQSLEGNLNSSVVGCYNSLMTDMKKQNDVNENYHGFNVTVRPNKIVVNISADVTTTKKGSAGQTQRYQDFQMQFPSNTYDILQTVNTMISFISLTCGFSSSYLTAYPNYDIRWYSSMDSSTVYTLKDLQTNEQFNFATRGCVINPI